MYDRLGAMRLVRHRGYLSIAAAVTFVGVVMLAVSLVFTSAAEWGAAVLVNVGATALLVIPIYVVTRQLDRRIGEVQDETRSSVENLVERVDAFEGEVERRLDEVAASVSSRLANEQAEDLASFDALLNAPTRAAVEKALGRAFELDLITQVPVPRVAIDGSDLYIGISLDPEGERGAPAEITFTIEETDGTGLEDIPWSSSDTVDNMMVRVGRSMQRFGFVNSDVATLFQGLREMLRVAIGFHAAARWCSYALPNGPLTIEAWQVTANSLYASP